MLKRWERVRLKIFYFVVLRANPHIQIDIGKPCKGNITQQHKN